MAVRAPVFNWRVIIFPDVCDTIVNECDHNWVLAGYDQMVVDATKVIFGRSLKPYRPSIDTKEFLYNDSNNRFEKRYGF